jgi:thiamine-monophosphate kinase
VVTATLSDLLAVGAEPKFLLNSLVVGEGMGEAWLAAFASGMQEALDAFGAFMLGGDAGADRAWRFTGVAVGTFPNGQRPLSRIVPTDRGVILATGAFGDGNLAAAGGPSPRFECRLAESRLITTCDAVCMDTSDGLAVTLQTIARLNASLEITLDLAAVPYADGVEAAAAALGVPLETFLLGSAGEYELVAFVPEAAAGTLLAAGCFTRIGAFSKGGSPGLFYLDAPTPRRLRVPGRRIPHERLPDPRDARSLDDYRAQLIALARKLFG